MSRPYLIALMCMISFSCDFFRSLSSISVHASLIADHIENDCREINCPKPNLGCPADSELKSSATDDAEDDADEDNKSNPFDRLAAEGLIDTLFPSLMLQSTTQAPHVVQKRSLQHRRREAIKIVPGDYRSFEPEFFKYHNHHQPHRKWKRDLVMGVQPHSEAEIKKCCPEYQCVCQTCSAVPKCGDGKMAVVVKEGHGLPGSCCSTYECVPEMHCNATSHPMNSYWRSECRKCDCFHGQELCQQLCDIDEDNSANNCFSEYLNSPKMNGDSWLEDQDCKDCKCVNGESQCEMSSCKPLDCENPLKVEGRCCLVCPQTTSTTTSTAAPEIISTATNITTTDATVTTTYSPVTTTDTPVTTTDTPVTTTDTPVTTTSYTSTSAEPATSNTSDTPEFVTEVEDDSTTYLPPTDIIITPKEIHKLLEQIYILAFASLVVVSFAVLVVVIKRKQKKNKSMYSTIPSSESSQSSSVTLA